MSLSLYSEVSFNKKMNEKLIKTGVIDTLQVKKKHNFIALKNNKLQN